MRAKAASLSFLMVGALLLTGCGVRTTIKHVLLGSPTSSASATGVFQIILPDGTSVPMPLDTLRGLTYQSILLSGDHEAGPSVTDVLTAAGVTTFSQVTVTGSGGASMTLSQDQLNDQVIFSVNKHTGTAKLAAMSIPEPQWVLNVSKVVVK